MMGTKVNSNYESLLTFTRASGGHALRPVSYGTELVTNGTFDTDSDWTKSITTIASGEATVGGTGGNGYIYQDAGLTVGTLYQISFDVISAHSSSLTFLKGGNFGSTSNSYKALGLLTTGTHAVNFLATSELIGLTVGGGNSAVIVIDNVSVKEVTFDQPDGTLTLFEHLNNVPRVEYDADGNLLGLLVEEARTNLVTYSEDFSNANWVKVRASVAENTDGVKAPDGSTAIKLTGSTDNNSHYIYVALTATGDRTLSVFAKKSELSWLTIANTSFASLKVSFDLQNGAVGSSIGFSSSNIENVGGGWYRCSAIVPSATADGNFDFVIALSSADGVVNFAGSSSEGVYIYGAQFEVGSFPTSYIKSDSGSTTTRSADVASIPVADFGYNQSAGTMLVQASTNAPLGSRTNDGVFSLQKDNNDLHRVYLASNDDLNWQMRQGGSTVFATSIITDIAKRQEFKISLSWHSGSQDASYDGNTATNFGTATTMADSAVDLNIGYINTTDYLNGHIKSIKYYPRRLTNAQLQDLTS